MALSAAVMLIRVFWAGQGAWQVSEGILWLSTVIFEVSAKLVRLIVRVSSLASCTLESCCSHLYCWPERAAGPPVCIMTRSSTSGF